MPLVDRLHIAENHALLATAQILRHHNVAVRITNLANVAVHNQPQIVHVRFLRINQLVQGAHSFAQRLLHILFGRCAGHLRQLLIAGRIVVVVQHRRCRRRVADVVVAHAVHAEDAAARMTAVVLRATVVRVLRLVLMQVVIVLVRLLLSRRCSAHAGRRCRTVGVVVAAGGQQQTVAVVGRRCGAAAVVVLRQEAALLVFVQFLFVFCLEVASGLLVSVGCIQPDKV